ncbi:MAG: TPM domain-containing protein [Bacteroidetes bacterium]|nr:TPM domain-containing protein [Bacteroidota bacterium]
MKYVCSLILLFLFACANESKQQNFNYSLIPKPTGVVSDFESFFSQDQKNKISAKIDSVNALGKIEIGLATFDSSYTRDSLFEEFALRVANNWGIGNSKLNNGVFICISFQMRIIQIKTGLGIEKYITNETVEGVIDDILIPSFRKQRFTEGIIEAVEELSRLSYLYIKDN